MEAPLEETIKSLAGHQFSGGIYSVEHWENFLLTECTGASLMQDGVVHPVVLFHMPIAGSGTSIAEMFALGEAESDLSIGIESYDWEMFKQVRESVSYNVSGQIMSAERCHKSTTEFFDRIKFQFEVRDEETLVARTTIIWHYARSALLP